MKLLTAPRQPFVGLAVMAGLGIIFADFFPFSFTNAESHDWLIAEAAYALGKDKHIILLVEDGANFNPTILGKDLEQIRFPVGFVEKSFTKLLQEFRDIGVRF